MRDVIATRVINFKKMCSECWLVLNVELILMYLCVGYLLSAGHVVVISFYIASIEYVSKCHSFGT